MAAFTKASFDARKIIGLPGSLHLPPAMEVIFDFMGRKIPLAFHCQVYIALPLLLLQYLVLLNLVLMKGSYQNFYYLQIPHDCFAIHQNHPIYVDTNSHQSQDHLQI